MGLFDSMKNRVALNLKVTRLSFMTRQDEIISFCQGLSREERAAALKNIESQFKWQSVAQVAQSLFPQQSSGVSADALDLVQGGYISAGVEVMRNQNSSLRPQYGMMPIQQAALSFAWTVLKSLEQRDAIAGASAGLSQSSAATRLPVGPAAVNFCSSCGTRRESDAKFCIRCGAAFTSTAQTFLDTTERDTRQQAAPRGAEAPASGFDATLVSHSPRGDAPRVGPPSEPASGGDDALFAQVTSMLQQGVETGEVTAERAESLQSVLHQFQDVVSSNAATPAELATKSTQMRELISRYKSFYTTPKIAATNRAGIVSQRFSGVRGYLFDQGNRTNLGNVEQQTIMQLLLEAGHINKALIDAGDDDGIAEQIEHDRIRPLMQAVRQFALRRHVMLAEPLWGWTKIDVNPNRIFFTGSGKLKQAFAELCGRKGLDLADDSAGWGTAQSHWNRLRECAVAIFDLTSDAKADRASVCHTLGSALSLGVTPLVVADPGAALPFDLDVRPVASSADLAAALDGALYSIPQVSGESSLADTTRETLERSTGSDATTTMLRKTLAQGERLDPVEVYNSLALLASSNSDGQWGLIRPTWPGVYPDPRQRRCFHITPFSEAWSNDMREAVRSACGTSVLYSRGDETSDPRVIVSIWHEICRASDIVVDLTGMNQNVCLELALAQALGRRTLLVAQNPQQTIRGLFAEIAKLQVRSYRSDSDLEKVVAAFLHR